VAGLRAVRDSLERIDDTTIGCEQLPYREVNVGAAVSEIMSQPRCWVDAAALASRADGLPDPSERVAVVGCGTSYNVALSYARVREDSELGETDAFAASEMSESRAYDRYIFISRSGTTTEVLDAMSRVVRATPKTVLTAESASPIARAADAVVLLDFANEESVLQTRFATSVVVLLRAGLGEDVGPVIQDANVAVDSPLPPGSLDAARYSFLGTGWTLGLAYEAALKVRESSQSWTEAYQSMEFRHGPISGADSSSLIWSLGSLPIGLESDLRATGATVVVSDLDPLAELIRIQRLAIELAASRGVDPDHPRHLSRSVILSGYP
jgi:fructoselysine-6-P-deglycase FrlB-like protein